MARKWTATIVVVDRRTRRSTTLEASESPSDLLRDQTASAVEEAYLLGVVDQDAYDVEVVLEKATRAGRRRDRSYRPFLDRRGVLRYDGPYA